ncbi:hypothetical protein Poly51_27960 [Rubripirellula tenax]|uniref:Uncharacterized protein n=1 Tax=Rubripirellula tenax TaxID=2528015 RepID=A0A5C6F685_9BACT|nr:hypothetical protein [Rubripirellula tenax]TWU56878.1 hypothetical protein Poly51_27960 [Rubripirellula tenax]
MTRIITTSKPSASIVDSVSQRELSNAAFRLAPSTSGSFKTPEVRMMNLAKITLPWLVLAAMISAPVAYFWAKRNTISTHTVQSRLIYNKTYLGSPLYEGPGIYTLLSEFQSKEAIEEVIAKRGLTASPSYISRQIESDVSRGDGSISVSLTWGDPEEAAAIANDLVEVGIRRARLIRDAGLEQHIVGLSRAIENIHLPEVNRLKEEYAELNRKLEVPDVRVAYDEWKDKLQVLEKELRSEQAVLQAAEEQVSRLESGVALVNTSLDSSAAGYKPKGLSPAAVVNRIAALEKDINEQREFVVLESKLESKESELARIAPLVGRGLVSQSRYNALASEVDQLRLQVRGDGSMVDLEQELERLNRQMDSFGDDPMASVETSREATRLKTELDTDVATSRILIEHLESSIGYLEPRLANLESSMEAAREIQRKLAASQTGLDQSISLSEAMETLKHGDAHSFRVVQPASPTLESESSNFKKLFASTFLICMIGLSAPVMGLGFRQVMPKPAETLADRMEIAEIGNLGRGDMKAQRPGKSLAKVTDAMRLTAVHLQYLTGAMTTRLVHVVGLSGRAATVGVVRKLGLSVAELGEDVTVVIVGGQPKAEGEIVEIEVNEEYPDNYQVVLIHESRAEEILSHLQNEVHCEGLILVTGLSCKERPEIELLSLKSNSVVLSAPAGGRITRAADAVVGGLRRFNFPILGVIS